MGALPLSVVLWVCRAIFAEALFYLFVSLLLIAGIMCLVCFLKRQAERQLDNEAARIAKHMVSSEPEHLCIPLYGDRPEVPCFRVVCPCYAWCW